MLNYIIKKTKIQTKPITKIIITVILLLMFRLGSVLPLPGIDQEMVKQSLNKLNSNNPIFQMVNMYSGQATSILTPFSLGIVPFINASIIIDLLTASFSFLEKLQSEEGDFGRKKLAFYKKSLALVFSVIQAAFLVAFIKPYFYNQSLLSFLITGGLIVTGSMCVIWFTSLIDTKGIGNGTSLIILTNIVTTLLNKQNFLFESTLSTKFIFECSFLLILIALICISQTARITIDVVSARQLAFFEISDKVSLNNKLTRQLQLKDNGLSIRLNQAGIFPIIIASNILPLAAYFFGKMFEQNHALQIAIYYVLITGFNYFYTILFWDPEKISEQLRKASVAIINISPGQETISYLENVARSSSILGGLFLCFILFCYDLIKQFISGPLLNQINISSLIIVVGVAYEIQKTIRALYKNNSSDIYSN
jgi:preprotein translocase subunit SecY